MRKFLSVFVLVAYVCSLAMANPPIIWNGTRAKLLVRDGIIMGGSDAKRIVDFSANPTLGAGNSAPIGSFGSFNDSGVGRLYVKTGSADTAWGPPAILSGTLTGSTAVVTDGSGNLTTASGVSTTEVQTLDGVTSGIQGQLDSKWGLTGNAATTPGTNFLGTTDAQDLVFKSNNTEALRIKSNGIIDTTLGFGFIQADSSGGLSTVTVGLGGSDVSGILPLAKGGTNKALTADAGTVTYSDSDSLEQTAVGVAGQVLISNGTLAPSWSTLPVDPAILPLSSGGTNKDMTASAGSVAYSDADSLELSAVGVAGQVLISNGTLAPSWSTLPSSSVNHSTLTSLDADDHSQYALLIGRAGGQILSGGSTASNNLTLRSTSHVTKGSVLVDESTATTSSTTGALVVTGGIGAGGSLALGGGLHVAGSTILNSGLTGILRADSGLVSVDGGGAVASTDHSALTNLNADDHPQYALLVGRSGGQILRGGSDASNNLTLRSTTNAAKGSVLVDETTVSTSPITGAMVVSGGLGLGGSLYMVGELSTQSSIVVKEPLGAAGSVRIQAPTGLASNLTIRLPSSDGTSGQVLSTDGAGNTSWATTASSTIARVTRFILNGIINDNYDNIDGYHVVDSTRSLTKVAISALNSGGSTMLIRVNRHPFGPSGGSSTTIPFVGDNNFKTQLTTLGSPISFGASDILSIDIASGASDVENLSVEAFFD